MGQALSKCGGSVKQQQLLEKWKEGDELKGKRRTKTELESERTKRKKLEKEVRTLQHTNKKQANTLARLKTGRSENSRGSSSKGWTQYTRQQQYNKKKMFAEKVSGALTFCGDEVFSPRKLEFENIETGNCELLDITNKVFSSKHEEINNVSDCHSALYVKDKYCISNEAFHELSMQSNLPSSSRVKTLAKSMNSKYEISAAPNGIVGAQQSLKKRITFRVSQLIKQYRAAHKQLPNTTKVKLTGDGTQIATGFSVVNIAFAILEGQQACSEKGNHKVAENYDSLGDALEDILKEAKDLEIVSVDGEIFEIQYFLGGDWKFLALVCGLEAATSEYACIWCRCPKGKRWDMSLTWSLRDPDKGGRSIEEITEKSKLSKSSKNRYNCSRAPLFSFVPLERVVIDSLHLFLRIADVLINLLIRDLRTLDGLSTVANKRDQSSGRNVDTYVDFLNTECKIRSRWYVNKDLKKVTWRDLTGPEKMRLFEHIKIPSLFPDLRTKDRLQELWKDFLGLVKELGKTDCNAVAIGDRSKAWVRMFCALYQTKDETPYIHAFAMHVSEFIALHGNIVMFSQQGLEKLNDVTTIHFQHSTNHREFEALKQLLEKRNRIEELEAEGFQRSKRALTCSVCKAQGHNKTKRKTKRTRLFDSMTIYFMSFVPLQHSSFDAYTQHTCTLHELELYLNCAHAGHETYY